MAKVLKKAGKLSKQDLFQSLGYSSFSFQEEVALCINQLESGLLVSQTGSGKTLAMLAGFERLLQSGSYNLQENKLYLLWISPLKALSKDLEQKISQAFRFLYPEIRIEVRTGDVSYAKKKKQLSAPPHILITTPESLSLLLSYEESRKILNSLKLVVVDEWHELILSKRGTLTELALCRLRRLSKDSCVWGLSATVSDPSFIAKVLTNAWTNEPTIIKNRDYDAPNFITLLPDDIQSYSWSGHIGLRLINKLDPILESQGITLIFTNTRNQAELWFKSISERHATKRIKLHHGSLSTSEREVVENEIRTGEVDIVIATSTLELGIDLPLVDKVIQIGSPKGVARFLQRIGRAKHKPGEISEGFCLPTNTFEILEFAALREAIIKPSIESQQPLYKPLDVLSQHICTIALGGGFRSTELLHEVRTAYSYQTLTDKEWDWLLDFNQSGGELLKNYSQFKKIEEIDGVFKITSKPIIKNHRLSIGTITSDSMVQVILGRAKPLGIVEESFISKIKPHDVFFFAGRYLSLVQFREMKAYVKLAKAKTKNVPRWLGGRLPMSTTLSKFLRLQLDSYLSGKKKGALEYEAILPLLLLQERHSKLPSSTELLIEHIKVGAIDNLFLYPFLGYRAHEGLASLLSYYFTEHNKTTISTSINDYGLQLAFASNINVEVSDLRDVLNKGYLINVLERLTNIKELSRRHFRDIARVSGMIHQGYPGVKKTNRQLQMSSGILFDVFAKYEPGNLFVQQSHNEVLLAQLEFPKMSEYLSALSKQVILFSNVRRLTPFSFPLWAALQQTTYSSETASERIKKMIERVTK